MGSYQADALQDIRGSIDIINDIDGMYSLARNCTGAFMDPVPSTRQASTIDDIKKPPESLTHEIVFDASRVARTASETRGANTAFAPRIIAF